MRRALLLALVALTLAVTALSCAKDPKRKVIVLEGHTSLTISFDVPVTGSFTTLASVCSSALTFLVSLDTDDDPAQWEWRFALEASLPLRSASRTATRVEATRIRFRRSH